MRGVKFLANEHPLSWYSEPTMLTRKRRHDELWYEFTHGTFGAPGSEAIKERRLLDNSGSLTSETPTFRHLVWILDGRELFILDAHEPEKSQHVASSEHLKQLFHEETPLPSCLIHIIQNDFMQSMLMFDKSYDLMQVRLSPIPSLQCFQNGTESWDECLRICGIVDPKAQEFFYCSLGLLLRPELSERWFSNVLPCWIDLGKHKMLDTLFALFRSMFEVSAVWHPSTRPKFPFESLDPKVETTPRLNNKLYSTQAYMYAYEREVMLAPEAKIRFWWINDLMLLNRAQLSAMIGRDWMTVRIPRKDCRTILWKTPGIAIVSHSPTKSGVGLQNLFWGFKVNPSPQVMKLPNELLLLQEMPAVLHRSVRAILNCVEEIKLLHNRELNYDNPTHMWFRGKHENIPGVFMPPLAEKFNYSCSCCLTPQVRAQVLKDANEAAERRENSSDLL